MCASPGPISLTDQAVLRLRVTLTVIKARVQLIERRSWPMTEPDQRRLEARLAALDESVNRAVDELAEMQQLLDDLAGRTSTNRGSGHFDPNAG